MNLNKPRWETITQILKGGNFMISVGIDISKGESTICILKPYGELISSPFKVKHTETELSELSTMLLRFNEEVRVVMESTGNYHYPVLTFLSGKGLFVSVINSLAMHKYVACSLRVAKTDKIDSIKIANYGIDNWYHLKKYQPQQTNYHQLQILGRQYAHYIEMRVKEYLYFYSVLDQSMPGIKKLISSQNAVNFEKDKLLDFAEKYWHFDNITKMPESEFIIDYLNWCKEKGYQASKSKALAIHDLAKTSIPTLDSKNITTQSMILESIGVLKKINKTLNSILAQMNDSAKSTTEYSVVRSMGGVGEKLAARLIAEIGDIRRFHSSKALIAYAGIDSPPYQSGQYLGLKRRISKRGSPMLRKIGYEVMQSLKSHNKPTDDSVYLYILKKEQEGKPKKVAKIAGLNKFLRIYYARVMEAYNN